MEVGSNLYYAHLNFYKTYINSYDSSLYSVRDYINKTLIFSNLEVLNWLHKKTGNTTNTYVPQ